MRDRECGDAHNSTGSVVTFMYFIPCPKPTISRKPRKSINQGREAQTVKEY